MKLTKKAADYERATKKSRSCAVCAYMHDDGTCAKVQGMVTPPMTCRLFRAKK